MFLSLCACIIIYICLKYSHINSEMSFYLADAWIFKDKNYNVWYCFIIIIINA